MEEKIKYYQKQFNDKLLLIATKIYVFLNNKNNFVNLWFIRNKKFIFVSGVLGTLLLTSFFFGYSTANEKYNVLYNKTYYLKLRIDSLKKDSILMETKFQEILTSKEYIIHKIYKESGILIPNNVPLEDINTMYSEAVNNDIPVRIFFRIIRYESVFKADAQNKNSNARGYMQLMPDIIKKYGRKLDSKNKHINNIKIGALYLKELYNYWDRYDIDEKEKWKLTLASYNIGIDRVSRHKLLPDTTNRYIKYILN